MIVDKVIGFTGPFSDINFGDYAMVVNNILDFDVKNVTLFSYDNNFLFKLGEQYLKDFVIDFQEVELKTENNTDGDRINTPIDILSNVQNYDVLSKKISQIDLLIVNGGGYFNSLWSMPHRIDKLIKIMVPALIARSLGVEVIFSGNGIGPFKDDKEFFTAFFGMMKNQTIGLRDNVYSPIWLDNVGGKELLIDLIPDDLLVLNKNLEQIEHRIKLPASKYMIMETYLPLEFISENIEKFKKFSETMHTKYEVLVYFLPFNVGNGGMEQAVFLSNELSNFGYYDLNEIGYLPIEDAKAFISHAELVISSRYHALVVALKNKTPIVSVLKDVLGDKRYYFNKNYGVLDQVLADTHFDQRQYMQLDYLDAMENLEENFSKIVKYQTKKYDSVYEVNMQEISKKRNDFIKKVQRKLTQDVF